MTLLKSDKNKGRFWLAWLFALAALLLSGTVYRVAQAKQHLTAYQAAAPAVSLKQFPLNFKNWIGEDIPTDFSIEKITHSDDFIYRLYRNSDTGQWVNVYVTYCSQPRMMLGHRPDVCYTSSGWAIKNTDKTHFTTPSGIKVPCIEYLFYKPAPWPSETTVLNYYIFNGRLTDDHKIFSGIKWRTLARYRDLPRYVTQIQISSTEEEAVISAAKDMSELIIDFFPDENGVVKAINFLNDNPLK